MQRHAYLLLFIDVGPLLFFLQTLSDTRSPFNSLLDQPCLQHDWPLLFKMHRFDFLHISPLSEFSLFFPWCNHARIIDGSSRYAPLNVLIACIGRAGRRRLNPKHIMQEPAKKCWLLSCDDDEPASDVANIISGQLLKKLFWLLLKLTFTDCCYVFFCQMESFFDCVYHWVNCY